MEVSGVRRGQMEVEDGERRAWVVGETLNEGVDC